MAKRSFLFALSILALSFTHTPAQALDQVPLAPISVTPVEAQVLEFASADLNSQYAKTCERILNRGYSSPDEKIAANKSYRKCKAEAALHHLSVWSWQDARN